MIPAAKTGNDSKSKITVIKIDHTNNGSRLQVIPAARILITVVMKLTAPRMDETPAK